MFDPFLPARLFQSMTALTLECTTATMLAGTALAAQTLSPWQARDTQPADAAPAYRPTGTSGSQVRSWYRAPDRDDGSSPATAIWSPFAAAAPKPAFDPAAFLFPWAAPVSFPAFAGAQPTLPSQTAASAFLPPMLRPMAFAAPPPPPTSAPWGLPWAPWASWLPSASPTAIGPADGWRAMLTAPFRGVAPWPMAFMLMGMGMPRAAAWPAAEMSATMMDSAQRTTEATQAVFSAYRTAGGHATTPVITDSPRKLNGAAALFLGPMIAASWFLPAATYGA